MLTKMPSDNAPVRARCTPHVGSAFGEDWRSRVGFVRDGLPWLWSETAQDWRPVTEIPRYAAAYAAMQAQR